MSIDRLNRNEDLNMGQKPYEIIMSSSNMDTLVDKINEIVDEINELSERIDAIKHYQDMH